MNKKKSVLFLLLSIVMIIGLSGCSKSDGGEVSTDAPKENVVQETPEDKTTEEALEEAVSETADSSITVVYTNDVHCYIDNVKKDSDGNITGDGLRFSKIAAMVNDMKADGKNVLLVDAGDEIQGNIYGAMDEGETIISIMNATGYQLATPGNHDFDYGVEKLLALSENAEFQYVSCNFHSMMTKDITFPDSYILETGGKKIAFVGITTPLTFTSSTPAYFQDDNGEFIYTIEGADSAEDLYTSVQNAIDGVSDKADYVIGIGHLGVGKDAKDKGWDSISVIENVSGFDAFIDGHSHSVVEGELIKDKNGNDVILTQTGCDLSAVGVMTISSDGTISTELVDDYDKEDESVAALEKDWFDTIDFQMNEKIAVLENKLYITNPDNKNERWIRANELNLGDVTADSVYWFFNERLGLDCDIALQNGGGIKAEIETGDVTYFSAKQVEPFGDMICLITATGQQIIDALEMGASKVGEWNDEKNAPAENGGFLQVAGLIYTVDTSVPCSVETDNNDMFVKVASDYRVRDVKVYNRATGKYEPIEPDREYQVGGINYILRNDGNGMIMFDEDELTVDYVGQDYVILAEYLKSFECEEEYPVINSKNSPLSMYEGYLLDYDNPLGSGRITILN